MSEGVEDIEIGGMGGFEVIKVRVGGWGFWKKEGNFVGRNGLRREYIGNLWVWYVYKVSGK